MIILVLMATIGVGVALGLFVRARHRTLRWLRAGGTVIETSRGPVEYVTAGDGPPVLVLHGGVGGWDQGVALGVDLLAPAESAVRYRTALAQARALLPGCFTLIALSRPGYLGTPVEAGATPAAAADAMAALLDALGRGGVHVIGVSGGGPTALQLALRHPGRTRSLIVMAAITKRHVQPTRTTDSPVGRVVFSTVGGWGLDLLVWFFLRVAHLRKRWLFGHLLSATETFDPPRLRERVTEVLAHPTWVNWAFGLISSCFPLSRRQPGLANDLAQYAAIEPYPVHEIRCPTLVVHGREDGNIPFDHAEFVADNVPHAELMVVEGCGHLIWLSEPADAVRARVVRFITEHDGEDRA